MNTRPDFSLILPCCNEESVFDASVQSIVSILYNSRVSFEIIFVDDLSHDATRQLIRKACQKNSFCRYLFHPKNIGRGGAVASGIRLSRGDIVGYMDIDCEVSPVYLPQMISLVRSGKADIVVGKRIYRTSLISIIREVLSLGYKTIITVLFKTHGIDTESGYKVFYKKTFLPVLSAIRSNGWFWDTESIVLSQRKNVRIVEIPVLFMRRFDKKSSVRLVGDSWEYIKNVWELYWRLRTRETP